MSPARVCSGPYIEGVVLRSANDVDPVTRTIDGRVAFWSPIVDNRALYRPRLDWLRALDIVPWASEDALRNDGVDKEYDPYG